MQDRFGREINYLRVSVTDRCNFRCAYCMPASGIRTLLAHSEILSYEEILEVVRASINLGITKFRVTGGEPLVRRDVIYLLEQMARLPGVDKLALTTNGYLLGGFAERLSKIGLSSINVALNSLDRDNFKRITGLDGLGRVLGGVKQLLALGFTDIKINTVLLKGYNLDEISGFARLTLDYPIDIRFIEYMPCGDWAARAGDIIKGQEIKKQISAKLGELIELDNESGCGLPAEASAQAGPARYYRLPNAQGRIGFILPVSQPFCSDCNRLRLTSDGHLKSCLLSDEEINLKHILREIKDEKSRMKELAESIKQAILAKPKAHCHKRDNVMSRIGG
ncbi:MAG TPA: GTP 3',8-cyclase MoaA [Planctomycetota bacterium]|nr:GTP 3',8-cyclase MoaA [Planctomycetota bacterium]